EGKKRDGEEIRQILGMIGPVVLDEKRCSICLGESPKLCVGEFLVIADRNAPRRTAARIERIVVIRPFPAGDPKAGGQKLSAGDHSRSSRSASIMCAMYLSI